MDRKSSCYYSEVKLLQNGCSVLFLFSVQEPDKATCTCWSLIKQQCCLTTDRTTMTCFVWGWGGSRHFFYGCLFFSEISTATFPTCRCPWLQRLGEVRDVLLITSLFAETGGTEQLCQHNLSAVLQLCIHTITLIYLLTIRGLPGVEVPTFTRSCNSSASAFMLRNCIHTKKSFY